MRNMQVPIKVKMGSESVRFTDDGKVFVNDALRLMTRESESHTLWERLKKITRVFLNTVKIFPSAMMKQQP